jgi:hypothetical protein
MTIRAFVAAIRGGAVVLVAGFFAWQTGAVGWSQVVGDEAEMDRLKVNAEDAIANDDPEGAAMSMGRAALMAKRLAMKHKDATSAARIYQGAETLFRSQEHAYRAMALFRRAGGQLPASSGVCGSLALAQGNVQQATSTLKHDGSLTGPLAERAAQLRATADDWGTVIASIISDYQCP